MESKRTLWRTALSDTAVWRRAVKLGLPVGLLQVTVNQGDVWLHHTVTPVVVAKSIISPMIGVAIALVSAAATYVESRRKQAERTVC